MFYLVHNHTGDENDNRITDIVFEAPSKDAVFAYLHGLVADLPNAVVNGDTDYLGCLYSADDSEEGCTCEDDRDTCDADHRTFHDDYYIQGEYENEADAEAARSRYHGDGGGIAVDKDGHEVELGSVQNDKPLTPFFIVKK